MAGTSSQPNPSVAVRNHNSSSSSSELYRTSSLSPSSTSHYSDSHRTGSVSSSSNEPHSAGSQNSIRNTACHHDEHEELDRGHEDGPYEDGQSMETVSQAEREARLRKRDYAVEISRIMGRQLVAAMNPGKRSKGRKASGYFSAQGDWSPIRER